MAIFSWFKKSYFLKRKIPIDLIEAISLSTESNEFVLHIPKEYDYRYSQSSMRNHIIKAIV